jgi:hypothetical protein
MGSQWLEDPECILQVSQNEGQTNGVEVRLKLELTAFLTEQVNEMNARIVKN